MCPPRSESQRPPPSVMFCASPGGRTPVSHLHGHAGTEGSDGFPRDRLELSVRESQLHVRPRVLDHVFPQRAAKPCAQVDPQMGAPHQVWVLLEVSLQSPMAKLVACRGHEADGPREGTPRRRACQLQPHGDAAGPLRCRAVPAATRRQHHHWSQFRPSAGEHGDYVRGGPGRALRLRDDTNAPAFGTHERRSGLAPHLEHRRSVRLLVVRRVERRRPRWFEPGSGHHHQRACARSSSVGLEIRPVHHGRACVRAPPVGHEVRSLGHVHHDPEADAVLAR